MVLPPTLPTATVSLAEPEMNVPDLAALYGKAVGEPVETLPALKRRAVAVFVRNEPWDRVLALAGEAGGFRLIRKDGALRLEATRFFNLDTLQRAAEKGLAPYANPVEDARKAFPAFIEVNYDRSELKGRPAAEIARILARRKALLSASSPERLVLARYLKRGGKLAFGKTVVVRFADYVSKAEFAAWDLGKEGLGPPNVAAFRLSDGEVEIGLDLEPDTERALAGFHPLTLPVSALSSYTEAGFDRTDMGDALAGVPWTKAPAPPLPWNLYRVGDVLGWIHAATGKPCVGTAVRIALPKLDENLPYALKTGPVRVSRSGDAYFATSLYGDGLWPADLAPLEALKEPTLESVAAYAASVSPVWDALLSREYGRVATPEHVTFNGGLPLLRLLGRATPAGLARLREGGRLVPAALDAGTAEALNRFLIEDAKPARAARRAGGGRYVVTAEFSTGPVLFYSDAAGFTTYLSETLIREDPEVLRNYFPDFTLSGKGVVESATLKVADLNGEPDTSGVSIAHRTSPKSDR